MQLSAFRYFLETVRLGSIRRAAEVLYVAPSAVSRQIALLEQDYGATLFERHTSGVRLTAAGEVFARHARSALRDLERLRSEIDDLKELRSGMVKIATVEAVVDGILCDAIDEFTRVHPGIGFDVHVTGSVPVMAAVADEECDFGISFEPAPHKDVVEIAEFKDPIVALVSPTHRYASRDNLTVHELVGEPVAMGNFTHVSRQLINRVFAEADLPVQCRLVFNQFALSIELAQRGQVVTIAPRHSAWKDIEAGRLRAVPIDHPTLLSTRFVLCRHKSKEPTIPAWAFLERLADRFARFQHGLSDPAGGGVA